MAAPEVTSTTLLEQHFFFAMRYTYKHIKLMKHVTTVNSNNMYK